MSAITDPTCGKLCTVGLIPKRDTIRCLNKATGAELSHNNDLRKTGAILAYKNGKPAPPLPGVCLHVHHLGPYGALLFIHSGHHPKTAPQVPSQNPFASKAVVKLSSGILTFHRREGGKI